MEKVFEPKATTWSERCCTWIQFPNRKLYLLPLIQRQQQLIPVFQEDGSVLMDVRLPTPELAELVNKFLAVATTAVNGKVVLAATSYAEFIQLVRRLLAVNYNFSTEELTEILTLTTGQFEALYSTILVFITHA